jgi:ERCC4-related helicase
MLLDNKNHGKVITELKKSLNASSKLAVLSGMFSIFGYSALKKELGNLADIRLLLSKWDDASLHTIAGTPQETRLKNKLDQSRIAKECTAWVKKNTRTKAMTGQMAFPPQNMFHISNADDAFVIQGASHFTGTGLGEVKSDSFEINMGISDAETTKQLLQWFDTIWNDGKATQNIKDELIAHLEYIASEKPASLVYFITLYNIFKDYLEDIDEESIIRSKTGFKDTVVWNKLYKFQCDGVMGAIDKLEKYNGCIIADSVGLGKTFEALAIIKYYELRNDRVLVLAPKKLRENWTVYTINDKRNLLATDRFNYDVLNHTDLSRDKGKSGEINLETINWGNYDLLVIDESHNFRNSGTKADGATRYQRLMDKIIRSGVKTKVLMLSATPVNSRMNDLKNQVAFITEGRDTALSDFGINSIEQTLKRAQTNFNKWLKLPDGQRKAEALLENLNFDYFKLLDLMTIARSRKHIEKYYDISEIGKFPERLKPMNIKSDIDTSALFPPLKDVNMAIKRLNLAAYSPLAYVRMDKKDEYSRKYDQEVQGGKSVFRQIDRETNIIHLMRINLLKRMESSINSFALTVDKIHGKINGLLEQIDAHENNDIEELSIEDIETDDPTLEDYLIGNKVKVLVQDMDLVRWKQDLEEDLALLKELLTDAETVDPTRDAKLLKLKEVITTKANSPFNPDNKKLVIFTAFSDTAKYLYDHISSWVSQELGLHSALVTGQVRKCTIKGINKDLNNLLTHFSPISKERDKVDPEATTEIDILIATDCISEGQNLQDCDTLVNYDIHWNPVRIIQRFGRVDRLGSQNTAIQLVNFWPNMELDEYINLEARVSGRMVLLDISATGEENVIEYDKDKQMNDLDYRRKQMKQLQTSVIDLEDMDGSVSITDMTLNDFRMDLSGYMKDSLPQLEKSPSGFYAAIQNPNGEFVAGTIFCLKDIHGKVEFDANYALAPYYIVYVAENGDIVFNHLQGKKSLDIFKKLCAMNKELDNKSIEALNAQTKNGKDMGAYQYMLECAMQSIVGKTEEKGVESLFARGGTVLTQDHFSGIEDFEVISYLIIKEVEA